MKYWKRRKYIQAPASSLGGGTAGNWGRFLGVAIYQAIYSGNISGCQPHLSIWWDFCQLVEILRVEVEGKVQPQRPSSKSSRCPPIGRDQMSFAAWHMNILMICSYKYSYKYPIGQDQMRFAACHMNILLRYFYEYAYKSPCRNCIYNRVNSPLRGKWIRISPFLLCWHWKDQQIKYISK